MKNVVNAIEKQAISIKLTIHYYVGIILLIYKKKFEINLYSLIIVIFNESKRGSKRFKS